MGGGEVGRWAGVSISRTAWGMGVGGWCQPNRWVGGGVEIPAVELTNIKMFISCVKDVESFL